MLIQRDLIPFEPAYEGRGVHVQIRVIGRLLSVEYTIKPGMAPLRIPPRSPRPMRLDGLWQATCCELFVTHRRREQYFEFNISPSGDWNAYFFKRYRHEMVESKTWERLDHFSVQERGVDVVVSVGLNTARFDLELEDMKLGLSAVLEDVYGDRSYWALEHPKPEPDFHDRGGWTLDMWEPEKGS